MRDIEGVRIPIMALRGISVFPKLIYSFDVGREKSIRALDEAMSGDQHMILLMQRDVMVDEPAPEDLYDVGVLVHVRQVLKMPGEIVRILVEGLDNCLIKFSRCCTPVPGDDIIGFITRGQGVSIHRKDCQNYLNRDRSPENEGRWIQVAWADTITDIYVTTITIASKDRNGLVMDIATVLNSMNAKVRNLSSRSVGYGQAITVITLEVKNVSELRYIMNRLSGVAGVTSVTRNGS